MDILTSYLTIISVVFVAMIAPGPDFLIVMRNALRSGRLSGVATSLGVSVAILIHVSYCLLGIALVISESILIFNIVKYLGAIYLFWLGYKALKSKGWQVEHVKEKEKARTFSKSFMDGFITNVLNPKATLFFLALFTQIVAPETSMTIQVSYGVLAAFMASVWFSLLSFFVTKEVIRDFLSRVSIWVDRVTGALFIGLGMKVASEKL